MEGILNKICECKLVPVVAIEDDKKSLNLAKAILDGGLNSVEITLRTECALDAIKSIHENCKDLILGAGTVLDLDSAKKAIDAGASYIVSPGTNEEIINYCKTKNILYIPGVATPTEIMKAYNMGIKYLKIFPAEILGGIKYIESLMPCFKVKYMPTGGVNKDNLIEYAKNPQVFAIGGSWMVKKDLISKDNWAEITRLCKEAKDIIKEANR